MSAIGDRPAASTDPASDQEALLHRGLGVGGIVFMVVAAVAPLGASAVVLPTVFALSGNAAAATYFIAAAVILCLFAVGFTLMSRYVHNAGAFYTYVQAGLGKIPGAGAASLALVSYLVMLISLYTYLGVAASAVVDDYLGLHARWWMLGMAAIVAVAFLGYRDIDVSAKVLGAILVLEVLLIMIVNLAVIVKGGDGGLSLEPLNPRHSLDGSPGLGLMFAFLAFIGFEATAVFRSEASDPNRTIPRATYVAVIFIGVLYALTSWAQAVGVGPAKVAEVAEVAGANPANVMVDLSARYVDPAMKDVLQVLLVTSIFACALSFHNVVTRYQFTLANGGLLPAPLGQVHPIKRAPSRSSLVVTTVTGIAFAVLAAAGLDPVTEIYTWLSGSGTLGILLLMTLTSVSVIVFHQRGGGDDPVWNAIVAPVLSLIGLCFVVYLAIDNLPLLVGGTIAAVAVCAAIVACFLLGVVVAAVTKVRRPENYRKLLA